jgi:lipoyl(octanoyl) transferase
MQRFTDERAADTPDEIWFLEHPPVFTQGMAGRAEHVLDAGDIPVVQIDRGGQVTYHGPGQLVVYPLLDLKRLGFGIRTLVMALEQAAIDCVAGFGIEARGRRDAPGVYVGARKLMSIGLRVRRGCSYHGLALNVATDLKAFSRINPCGYAGLEIVNLRDLGGPATPLEVCEGLATMLCERLRLQRTSIVRGAPFGSAVDAARG